MPSVGSVTSLQEVVHHGIEYPGEVVRATGWDAPFGEELRADAYFRVVFLEAPNDDPPGPFQDSRIAVCVPRTGPDRAGEQTRRELRVVREAQTQYLEERAPAAEAARQAMESQARELEGLLSRNNAQAYAAGRILCTAARTPDPADVFADGDMAQWARRLGGQLLAQAYPRLPISPSLMDRPLRPERDAPLLFDGVMLSRPRMEALKALDSFAPALGLRNPDAPGSLDPSLCPAFRLIETELEERGVEADGRVLEWRLAHYHGLTYPLADLFMLLCVRHGGAPLELGLRRGHGLRRRDGEPLPSNRLTGEMVSSLAWPADLRSDMRRIGPARDDPWEQVLPYLQTVDPQFELPEGPPSTRRRLLQTWVNNLSRAVYESGEVSGALESLAQAQGREWRREDVQGRLQKLVRVGDERGLLDEAQRLFGTVREFQADLRRWQAWRRGLDAVPRLVEAIAYLDDAALPEGSGELATERQLLLQRLRSSELLVAPHQWPGLVEAALLFRRRFATAYIRHHDAYHAQMGLLGQRMAGIRLQAQALERLNVIRELGDAVAPELAGLVEELYNSVAGCPWALEAREIERSPRCPACGLSVEREPPTREVEELGGYVAGTLGQQNRRLGGKVASRLLRSERTTKLQRFIDVVQVSDLSGLAQVLSDELVQFIRELLSDPSRERGA